MMWKNNHFFDFFVSFSLCFYFSFSSLSRCFSVYLSYFDLILSYFSLSFSSLSLCFYIYFSYFSFSFYLSSLYFSRCSLATFLIFASFLCISYKNYFFFWASSKSSRLDKNYRISARCDQSEGNNIFWFNSTCRELISLPSQYLTLSNSINPQYVP